MFISINVYRGNIHEVLTYSDREEEAVMQRAQEHGEDYRLRGEESDSYIMVFKADGARKAVQVASFPE